ncbi:Vacuolar iron transporter homolog 4 [Linum grandiflorum]
MMGVGAVRQDIKAMILTGFAGLIAGACSMAIGEFVSVYSQYDIEVAQMKRDNERGSAFGLAFSLGAMVPLLAASFIKPYRVRLGAIVAAVSLALVVFGWIGAVLGKAPVVKSSVRVLVGGWVAMAITFALTKSVGSTHMNWG